MVIQSIKHTRVFCTLLKGAIYVNNYNMNQERLQDLDSKGNVRPWREKKSGSLNLASSYGRLKQDDIIVVDKDTQENAYWLESFRRFEAMVGDCASYIEFENVDGKKKLKRAFFCQKRLCPMCNWRKSIKTFTSVSKVMDAIQTEHPDLQPVFLTLTQRNCAFEDLEAEIKRIFEGFHRLVNNRVIKEQVEGWFRALEVTYNKKTNTWHPHLHVIMLFPKAYFSKKNKRYLDTAKWVRLWRLSMRLDYDPVADIRAVKVGKDGDKRKAIAEVAKYPLKDKTILTKNKVLTDKLVACLTKALHRKRLYAFGGIMAKTAKALRMDNFDDGDLVKVGEDETVRSDVASIITAFRWDFGLMDYVRIK